MVECFAIILNAVYRSQPSFTMTTLMRKNAFPLLQEQRLLLEDLLEQEKREQAGQLAAASGDANNQNMPPGMLCGQVRFAGVCVLGWNIVIAYFFVD